ncbi:hypothetical protein [Pseudomonas putida]|uniref:hypothetical protein n=1 Tax=Pseudomonas putida TaxID=303 RepID=UPI0024BB2E63|nr:hypothetical protein [Pseudomonas putida]
MRQVLKGIRTLHPAQTKQAAPLQLQHLEQAIQWLSREAEQAQQSGNLASLLRSRRDAALLLIGFWRVFVVTNSVGCRSNISRPKPVRA